jgi:hypothetical protein
MAPYPECMPLFPAIFLQHGVLRQHIGTGFCSFCCLIRLWQRQFGTRGLGIAGTCWGCVSRLSAYGSCSPQFGALHCCFVLVMPKSCNQVILFGAFVLFYWLLGLWLSDRSAKLLLLAAATAAYGS